MARKKTRQKPRPSPVGKPQPAVEIQAKASPAPAAVGVSASVAAPEEAGNVVHQDKSQAIQEGTRNTLPAPEEAIHECNGMAVRDTAITADMPREGAASAKAKTDPEPE